MKRKLLLVALAFLIVIWKALLEDILLAPISDFLAATVEPILSFSVYIEIGWILSGIILLGLVIYLARSEIRKFFISNISVENDMKNFIKRFTEEANKRHYVIATQIYRYHLSKTSNILKINYQDGYVVEGEPINAVIQEHFRLEKKLYRTLEKAVKKVQVDGNDLTLLDEFMNQQITQLDQTPNIANNNKELNQFHLLVLSIQFFLNMGNNNKKILDNMLVSVLKDPEKEDRLYTMTRSGLIRAILNAELGMSALYSFSHIRENDKKGRVYLSIQVKREKDTKPYIFLITVSPEIKEEEDQIYIITEILEDFIKTIKSEFGETEILNLESLVV